MVADIPAIERLIGSAEANTYPQEWPRTFYTEKRFCLLLTVSNSICSGDPNFYYLPSMRRKHDEEYNPTHDIADVGKLILVSIIAGSLPAPNQ